MLTPQEKSAAQFAGKGQAYAASVGHAHIDSLQTLITGMGLRGSERALDIATGGGHLAHALAPHVRQVVALDLVDDMLAQARKAGVVATRGMAERLPFADGAFNVVGCRLAAHHFADVDLFLRECHRVLLPGGQLLIVDVTVPEDRDVADEINRIEALRDPSHGRNLPPSEWRSKAETAGFTVEHIGIAPFGGGIRMEFNDWTRRIGTPASNLAPLRESLEQAGSGLREALRLAIVNSITFELDEISLLARK